MYRGMILRIITSHVFTNIQLLIYTSIKVYYYLVIIRMGTIIIHGYLSNIYLIVRVLTLLVSSIINPKHTQS